MRYRLHIWDPGQPCTPPPFFKPAYATNMRPYCVESAVQ